MEDIKVLEWIKNSSSPSYGWGKGSGFGSDIGYGFGCGCKSSSGYGSGNGSGYAYDYNDGSGFGSGSGSGSGSDSDYGDGSGNGIRLFNDEFVYLIDNVQTIISTIKGNLAKGFILNANLTLSPCYICKNERYFVHGETLKKAKQALRKKIFENMDTDEAIEHFLSIFEKEKKYPAKDFYKWHHYLTGSCELGRKSFMRDRNINFDDMYTVDEFIKICEDSYGGEIIKELKERWKCRNGSD